MQSRGVSTYYFIYVLLSRLLKMLATSYDRLLKEIKKYINENKEI